MAIPGGHRFPITVDEWFFVMSVDRAVDCAEGGKSKPAVCKITGLPVWAVQGTDPSTKGKNTGQVAKMAAAVQPVPPETLVGTPFRPAAFLGLKVTPYVRNGWVNYTIRADDMVSALARNRGVKAESKPAQNAA